VHRLAGIQVEQVADPVAEAEGVGGGVGKTRGGESLELCAGDLQCALVLGARAGLADLVYLELPDAEGAGDVGPLREEFFIEHHHVFSYASAALLATRAGFDLLAIERLREPSTKYTIRVFAAPRSDTGR